MSGLIQNFCEDFEADQDFFCCVGIFWSLMDTAFRNMNILEKLRNLRNTRIFLKPYGSGSVVEAGLSIEGVGIIIGG